MTPRGYEFYLTSHLLTCERYTISTSKLKIKFVYDIDTDEIPGFLLLLKSHIFTARSEHIIFIFHMWGYRCRHGNEHD